jgi:hypothetical protein
MLHGLHLAKQQQHIALVPLADVDWLDGSPICVHINTLTAAMIECQVVLCCAVLGCGP